MNQELIQALANELLQAEDTATPIPPLTDRYPEMTIDDAYAVQKAVIDKKVARGEVVIGKSDRFVGNGHCSEIVQDGAGNDWILYHGVDLQRPEGRMLFLDRVLWDEAGWPYVAGGTPSLEAEAPEF